MRTAQTEDFENTQIRVNQFFQNVLSITIHYMVSPIRVLMQVQLLGSCAWVALADVCRVTAGSEERPPRAGAHKAAACTFIPGPLLLSCLLARPGTDRLRSL